MNDVSEAKNMLMEMDESLNFVPMSEAEETIDLRPIIIKLTRLGFTIKELSHILGIKESRVGHLIFNDQEFRLEIERSRTYPNYAIEQSLFKSAMGFEQYQIKSVEGKPTEVTLKQVAPNVRALMFWLTNRMPSKWNNVRKSEVTLTLKDEADIAVKKDE